MMSSSAPGIMSASRWARSTGIQESARSPDHLHRQIQLAVPVLDVVGEAFVGGGDLTVERCLTLRGQPGGRRGVHLGCRESAVAGAGDVGLHGSPMDSGGLGGEDGGWSATSRK